MQTKAPGLSYVVSQIRFSRGAIAVVYIYLNCASTGLYPCTCTFVQAALPILHMCLVHFHVGCREKQVGFNSYWGDSWGVCGFVCSRNWQWTSGITLGIAATRVWRILCKDIHAYMEMCRWQLLFWSIFSCWLHGSCVAMCGGGLQCQIFGAWVFKSHVG